MFFHFKTKAPFILLIALLTGCQHVSKPVENATLTTTTTNNITITRPIPSAFNLVPRGIDYSTPPEVVAFSSCANQDAPQPL